MSALKIDADALFRAVVSYDYKLLAYYLDLRNGEIVSRTLTADEIHEPPPGPSVPPLPLLGGDVNARHGEAPFGPLPTNLGKKPDLFAPEKEEKKNTFDAGFWKRERGAKVDPFGGGGYQRESATMKLAAMFGEAPPEKAKGPAGTSAPSATAAPSTATPAATAGTAPSAARPGVPPTPTPGGATPAPSAMPSEAGVYVAPVVDPAQPLQRIPPANTAQNLLWYRAFARDCGDPKIREELLAVLHGGKPFAAFERVLRKYQRLGQQWEGYYRKQALHYAAAWLKDLPIEWKIVETR